MQHATEDPRSDHDLIAAVNDGDAGAFEVLYFRHYDWVVNLAFRITGDRNAALDVLQETFLYFLKKFPGFTLKCQLRSFFYPAVRNLAIAARRKAMLHQSSGASLEEIEAHASVPGDDRDPVAAVVAALPDTYREVLLLRFVDDLSLDEIAEALEIPLGTVKSRLHNALACLRRDERTRTFFQQ